MLNTIASLDFSRRLLAWFDAHGRHDLPWQKNITPYRVWIAEIMLQQTQVATVIPYFERFMEIFPQLTTLANATADEVLHVWTGLGYYARARNLHKAAKIICTQYNAYFPHELAAIMALPGIGRSTAGAIFSIAWQQRAPILDGNVRRVLCRVHALAGSPTETQLHKQLWDLAEYYTPTERMADYSQAIMDLGATLCKHSKPDCLQCPLKTLCLAYQRGRTSEFPQARSRKILPLKQVQFIVLLNQHRQVLLQKRPPSGIWGGLWSLPEYVGSSETLVPWCEQQFFCRVVSHATLASWRHTFSHFHLQIQPILLEVNTQPYLMMEAEQQVWYNIDKPSRLGLAAPIKKLLKELGNGVALNLLPKITTAG